jgi:Uma2 family endonuclease
MRSVEKSQRVSLEAYLAYDDSLDGKSEYFDGEIFDMAGVSYAHAVICSNLSAVFYNALKGTGCRASSSDIKVQIEAADSMTYPDLSIVCGTPELAWPRKDILRNPTVIVEVLSPGTDGYDRGGKFRKYKRLRSLREYVLVEQDSVNIDVFFLNEDGVWNGCGDGAAVAGGDGGVGGYLSGLGILLILDKHINDSSPEK